MNGDFRNLIKKAIGIESKMADFYGKMATQATTPETREVFKILAGEEEEHRVLLANYLEEGTFPQVSPVGEADLAPTLKVVASITDEYGSPGGPGVRDQVGRISASVLQKVVAGLSARLDPKLFEEISGYGAGA